MLTALMVWGQVGKGLPYLLCSHQTDGAQDLTSCGFQFFKSHTPISQLLPKICTIKVCMYLCVSYKTHIPQTLKINEIKINKHSNTVLCNPTR